MALILLTIGSVANVVTGLSGAVLSMTHREGISAKIQWVGLGVRLILGPAAALTIGLDGLAASAGFVTAGVYVALWLATKRELGISTLMTPRPDLGLMRKTFS